MYKYNFTAMSKLLRQNAILDLVQSQPLASQEDLRRRLAAHGFRVTQATLSRDVHELRLVKLPDEGYALQRSDHPLDPVRPSVSRLMREFVTGVNQAQNLLVLKTTAGSAQPVAASLDAQEWPQIVGTIAGDDTVLIISPDKRVATRLAQRIRGMLV